MILNLSSSHYLAHDAQLEQRVRTRLQQAGIPEADYPYLMVLPYLCADQVECWLAQNASDPNSYLFWKGWCLFRHEEDVVAACLAWPTEK